MIIVKAVIKNVKTNNQWEEEFEVFSMEKAQEKVQWVIDRFNETCSPGESHRALVRIVGDTNRKTHDWDKQTLVFQEDKVGVYNDWKCTQCGLKRRVYGINHPGERKDRNECYPKRTCSICNNVYATEKNCEKHKEKFHKGEE